MSETQLMELSSHSDTVEVPWVRLLKTMGLTKTALGLTYEGSTASRGAV